MLEEQQEVLTSWVEERQCANKLLLATSMQGAVPTQADLNGFARQRNNLEGGFAGGGFLFRGAEDDVTMADVFGAERAAFSGRTSEPVLQPTPNVAEVHARARAANSQRAAFKMQPHTQQLRRSQPGDPAVLNMPVRPGATQLGYGDSAQVMDGLGMGGGVGVPRVANPWRTPGTAVKVSDIFRGLKVEEARKQRAKAGVR